MRAKKTMTSTPKTMNEVNDVYAEAAYRISNIITLLESVAGRKDCELGRWLGRLGGVKVGLECRLTGQVPEVRCGDQDCGWDLCSVRFPYDDLNTDSEAGRGTLSA